MSMDHKAFVFDDTAFERQLKPMLEAALESRDPSGLRAFILDNFDHITDPIEGEPLPDDWEDALAVKDVHEYGDYALTKFYDPRDDFGLSTSWDTVQDLLEPRAPDLAQATLGMPVGPPDNRFDPGKMGSYFQSAADAREALDGLETLLAQQPALSDELDGLRGMLQSAADADRGLYVTF